MGHICLWISINTKKPEEFERLIDEIRSGHITVPLNPLACCEANAMEAAIRGIIMQYYHVVIIYRFVWPWQCGKSTLALGDWHRSGWLWRRVQLDGDLPMRQPRRLCGRPEHITIFGQVRRSEDPDEMEFSIAELSRNGRP
jgi:hypothetical protein